MATPLSAALPGSPSATVRQAVPAITTHESYSAGVSWAAVIAGAFIAASLALVLLALGAGVGFASVSPWWHTGASAQTLGVAAIVWLCAMQAIASGMGGYLAGRLRTKWVTVHTDEVFFRDTAHGFLTWAVAVVIAASVLTTAASSLVKGAGTAVLAAGNGLAEAHYRDRPRANPEAYLGAYFVDMLFRADHRAVDANDAAVTAEAGRIVAVSLANGVISSADKTYLTQVVAARTGLTSADAERRVTDTITQAQATAMQAAMTAREAADVARKAAAQVSLWTFVSLLIGAFCASYAATLGGRRRDHVTG